MSKLDDIDISALVLVKYPDPRLRETCTPVEQFDSRLAALVEKMFAIMYESNGVGLAASQVGVTVRLFVCNPTMTPGGERVYINPELSDGRGGLDDEEGCLSFPSISCRVKRFATISIRARGLDGSEITETGDDLLARIFQHETDHLDGRLLVDRMSPIAKIANRRLLKEMEEAFGD